MEDDKEMVDIVAATHSDGVIDDAAGIDGHTYAGGTQASSYEKDTDGDGITGDDDNNVYGILGSDNVSIADDSETLAASHFKHRPLETPDTQIRLLWLHPGDPEDEINCTVSTWTLGESPEFSAISYTWGPPEPEASICLWSSADSHSAKRHVHKVRENARYALWQVRLRCPGSFVWIDSICIDQENLEEKGAQVAIMSNIYSNAHEVFACIGPADQSSDAIEEVCRDIDGTVQDTPDDEDCYSVYKNSWKPPKGEAALLEIVDHWDTFSDRQYFHRLWVVQELYSGGERSILLCGNYILSWSCLTELQRRLQYWFDSWFPTMTSRQYCSKAIRDLDSLIRPRTMANRPATDYFQEMIGSTLRLKCDDPRDRVYGILGIVDWERFGVEKPVPNYDISPFDLALSLLPQTGSVDIFLADIVAHACGVPPSMEEDQIKSLKGTRIHWMGRATPRTSPWYTTIYGICLVQQDSHGRLSVDLKQTQANKHYDLRVLEHLQTSPKTVGDLPLPFSGGRRPVELYTGDEVSALAWPQVRHEDIILLNNDLSVVLRRSDVEAEFYIVGKALFLNGYRPKDRDDWTCDCWGEESGFGQDHVSVTLSGVSDVDVLAYNAFDSMRPSERAQQLSLDFPPFGSVVRNYTPTHLSGDFIRPLMTSCTVHDAVKCNRWRQNGLEFAIASGCGLCFRLDR